MYWKGAPPQQNRYLKIYQISKYCLEKYVASSDTSTGFVLYQNILKMFHFVKKKKKKLKGTEAFSLIMFYCWNICTADVHRESSPTLQFPQTLFSLFWLIILVCWQLFANMFSIATLEG